jgi:hypothetical protein
MLPAGNLDEVELNFRRDVNEICALPGYQAVYSGNSLPTFRHNLAAPPSKVNNFSLP